MKTSKITPQRFYAAGPQQTQAAVAAAEASRGVPAERDPRRADEITQQTSRKPPAGPDGPLATQTDRVDNRQHNDRRQRQVKVLLDTRTGDRRQSSRAIDERA